MSQDVVFNRRDFLKLAGIGAAGALSGCAQPSADRLIPYLIAPNDILPGVAYWYASTCRECPVGCGLLVKTREGRAIKVEGNPAHPVNQGALCGRGQATLQGLYNPDRIATPMAKDGGQWKKVTWDEAIKRASEKLGQAVRDHRGVAIVTENATGSFEKLAREWATAAGGAHLVYEPFSYESLREANRRTFGIASVPAFDFARAKTVVSFGADFLETFGSPVAQARGFATMRARPDSGYFVAVEPRLSLTGANADEWVAVRPGGEMALALGMARVILTEGLGAGGRALGEAVAAYTPEAVEEQTDVPADQVIKLARRFAEHRPSLAVAGGVASQSEQSVALIAAVNLLNQVAGNVGETVRFDRTLNYDAVAPFGEVQRLIHSMEGGEIDVLVVHGANPVYAAPAWSGFATAMGKVQYRISLSGMMDETTDRCDLVLPSLHALESLGDAEATHGVYSILQPTMKPVPMFDAHPAGDTLIALAKASGFGAFPAAWSEYLIAQWQPLHKRFGAGKDWTTFWDETLKNGGVWESAPEAPARIAWGEAPAFAAPALKGGGGMALVLYASPNLYDGRGANKPWLQELPDPTTKAVWGSWIEIHPEAAAGLGIALGDPVKVETSAGSVTAPAYLYAGIRKDCVAIPLGQGHTAYGRYANGRGLNALDLLPASQDAASGAVATMTVRARVSKAAGTQDLALTQREKFQDDRQIAQVIPVAVLLGTAATPAPSNSTITKPGGPGSGPHEVEEVEAFNARLGKYTEPRQKQPGEKTPAHAVTAYEPEHKARAPRQIPVHEGSYKDAQHRWALAIDLNSCNGCQACIVACYAENNIPTVGPELVKRGREMTWIRIERYEERIGAPGRNDVRFVPMMCQQCGDAPCEPVCPVYATYHNPEGLNAQVYNRCVGTRYCSNNCPYKVRAFNFFDYSAPEKATFSFPEPLNWQLNPDVTVRSKGVMEKCTFCVQRILEGKGDARDENRPLRDGDIQTACAQGCPTQAIVFGDLMDPDSRVSKLSHGERRYWALNDLNTKPGVTYLKKLERETT